MRYASWQSATCENVARKNYRHSEISVQSLGKDSLSRAISTLTYFSLVMCRQRACKMPLAVFRLGSDLRDPLVVTLDRLFVSRHVKTWDNRVGDTANLFPVKNGRISRGLYCTNLSFLAQLLGHVLEMYSTCTRKYCLLSQDEKSSVYSNSKLKKYRISCSENRLLNVCNLRLLYEYFYIWEPIL